MPTPFFKILKTRHTVPRVTSRNDTPIAIELQTLMDAGDTSEYNKRKDTYLQGGEVDGRRLEEDHEIRQTKGVIYETEYAEEEITLDVAVQVN